MAIQWGSYGSTGTGLSYRVGVDLSLSYPGGSLDRTDTQATVTGKVYVQMASGHTGYGINGRVAITGDHSQTIDGINWSVNSGGGTNLLLTFTDTVSLNYGSSQTYSVNVRFRGVTTWNFTPSKKASITVPARPYAKPAAQTSLSVARSSDTRQNLSWTRNATTAAPYSSQEVWRSTDGGSYTRVASLSGTATSWNDTSTSANRRYTYRLRAVNSSGSSPYSATRSISTTPATPSAPTATKLSSGDIRITRSSLSSVAVNWQVREVGTSVLYTLSASTTSWTHSTPDPQVTHTYEIRAVSSDPTLYSGWSAKSNTVQLLTAPAAPTNLAPNGAVRDATESITVTWDHNPLDSSEQRKYEFQWRLAGSSSWTSTGVTTSDVESRTLASFWSNGSTLEWRIRTWGAATTGGSDGTGASPWSAVATIQMYAKPVAGTVDPDGSADIMLPSHLFEWSFYQEQGLTQSQWQIEVRSGSLVIAGTSGSGTGRTWQSPAVFEDGGVYSWRVRVRDSKSVWSDWTPQQSFTAEFIPPNDPSAVVEWYRDGYVRLDLLAVNDGTSPDTVSMTVRRSIDGGEWVLLAEGLDPETEYLDWTATVAGENCYRITAVTAAGATSTITECVVVGGPDCDRDVYIGGGPDLGMVVRFGLADTVSVTTGRQRVLNEFDGRFDPVETSGPSVPYSINVKAKIPPPVECGDLGVSDPRLVERVFHLPGPHLYRDWTGRHMFVSLSPLQYDEAYLGDVSFSVTRADGGTEAQRSAIGAYVGPYLVESPDGEYRITGGTMTEVNPGEWVWTP